MDKNGDDENNIFSGGILRCSKNSTEDSIRRQIDAELKHAPDRTGGALLKDLPPLDHVIIRRTRRSDLPLDIYT